MRKIAIAVLLLGSVAAPAMADDSSYVDDRSTATTVIESFYNAINRSEYARAYSYFGDSADNQPFSEFQAGYADTAGVTLKTGDETSEGAAGSTYYTLPVAIDAEATDGTHKVFAGCYQLRLVQPALQEEPPFAPLHIEKGTLKPVNEPFEKVTMTTCPES
ncbi:MAG: hypothetical protein JWP26_4124 [Devosia sp.]|uniref:hypothetical protein n=1 Tax=Devosia sp. TaxID=1871048 RepID=UPI00262C4A5E|nr:hypothetical protein [Devosia sp.]MDB5589154.1 hypothetical protein [Devosia sp.]